MKLSNTGANLMHQYEGCRNKPYLCPAHIWTIGYGHVLYQEQIRLPMVAKEGQSTMIRKEFPLKQEDNRVWSKEEIEKLFADDVNLFERGVLRLAPTLSGHQGAFDACVSFAFNAGLGNFQRSTIRMKINRGEWKDAAEAFMQWTKGGGRELPGLVKRRKAEVILFLTSFKDTEEE
jgi:lysozyme